MKIKLIDAGFRSRVRYINVLDPSSMCYYISEILDAGRGWPLFMVLSPYFQLQAFVMQLALYIYFLYVCLERYFIIHISDVNLLMYLDLIKSFVAYLAEFYPLLCGQKFDGRFLAPLLCTSWHTVGLRPSIFFFYRSCSL